MRRSSPHRARCRAAALLLGALTVMVAVSAPALAHAEVEGATPEMNGVVERPPDEVTMQFDVPVQPLGLRVYGPDGSAVDSGDVGQGGEPTEIRVELPTGLPAGKYTVEWRAQAGDSHVQRGSWTFTATEALRDEEGPDVATVDPGPTGDADHGDHAGARADVPRQNASNVSGRGISPLQLGLAAMAGLIAAAGALLSLHRLDTRTVRGSA